MQWGKTIVLAVMTVAAGLANVASESDAGEPALLDRIGCGSEVPASHASLRGSNSAWEDEQELEILIVGSSSTAGSGAGSAERAYPAISEHILDRRLKQVRPRSAVTVVARGVGGERAKGALGRLGHELEVLRPDILVWQVGTNDAIAHVPPAQFRETLEQGVALARARGVDVILVDPQFYPGIEGDPFYAELAALVDTVGSRSDAPVVHRFERMQAAAALDPDALKLLLAADRFHMSALGHECLARDVAEAILPKGYAAAAAAFPEE